MVAVGGRTGQATRGGARRAHRLLAAAMWLTFGGGAAQAVDPPTPVTLQLSWTHQAHFGGFYVADRQGLYARQGLSVRFLEGGPNADLIAPLADGRAQFGIAAAPELIITRAGGKPVRAIATILRRSPTVYVSKADHLIRRPEDFVGKTIRVTAVDTANLRAMMSRARIRPEQYRLVTLPSDVELFASGAADVWSVYVNNFAVTLEELGHKLNYVYPDDYGVHFYADTLFTTDALVAERPDLIRRFVRASLDGWTIAVEEPSLVGQLTRTYDPKAYPALEARKMRATQALVNTGEDRIGWMREPRWTQMTRLLDEQGLLPNPVRATDVFTMAFLHEIYGHNPETR